MSREAGPIPDADEIADPLIAAGRAVRLETRGRRSGRLHAVTVGFGEEPDGSLLVAAGSPDADWALNLLAEPRCAAYVAAGGSECDPQPASASGPAQRSATSLT